MVTVASLFSACQLDKVTALEKRKKHWIEIGLKNEGMMYLDAVPNNLIMNEQKIDTAHTRFYSFLVGFQDSILRTDQAKEIRENRYYEYEMPANWTAIVNGDSLRPVFSQTNPKIYKQNSESILVFELPQNHVPDTLIYQDTYGPWGLQKIVLSR